VIGCCVFNTLKVCALLAAGLFVGAAAGMLAGCTSHTGLISKEDPPLQTEAVMKHWEHLSAEASPAASPEAPHQGVLSPEAAIEEALRASPELEQLRQRINAASEQVRQAEASFYPRLIVSEEYSVTTNPVFALMDIVNQRRFNTAINFNDPGRQQNIASKIQGEWVLFQGGSSWHDRRAAQGRQRSVEAELQAARNQMVAKVTETYYQWLRALSFIGVAERAFESAGTDERLGEARLQQEMALPSELMRLKAHGAEAHGNLVTARTHVRRLQAGLERLLARPIRSEEIPDPALYALTASQENIPAKPDALVKQALEKRPEMSAARSLIQAARERVRSTQGGLLPRIGANATYEWDSEDFSKNPDSWMVGIQASWPLFEGGVTLAGIREAKARLKEMEARGEQVALDIAMEVHQAVLAVQDAVEKIQVADERRKYAQSALEEVRRLYQGQVVTVDSLLQAEVAWNQAEVSYTAALFEQRIAQALLRQSLGDFANWIVR